MRMNGEKNNSHPIIARPIAAMAILVGQARQKFIGRKKNTGRDEGDRQANPGQSKSTRTDPAVAEPAAQQHHPICPSVDLGAGQGAGRDGWVVLSLSQTVPFHQSAIPSVCSLTDGPLFFRGVFFYFLHFPFLFIVHFFLFLSFLSFIHFSFYSDRRATATATATDHGHERVGQCEKRV